MSIKLATGKVRISYANIWEPRGFNGQEPKYSVSLIISKDDKKTLSKLQETLKAMMADPENIKKWGGKSKGIRIPLRDGDEDRADDPAYANSYFVNASATPNHPPRIVDRDKQEILDGSEVYSGCYCQAVITLFAYNTSGNKGIGVGLAGLRKLADGVPLSGAIVTDDDFGDDDFEYDPFGGARDTDIF